MELSQNCEGCKYRENNNNCSKLVKTVNGRSILCSDSEAENCISLGMSRKMFSTLSKDYYVNEVSRAYYNETNDTISSTVLDEIKNDMEKTAKFKSFLSSRENIKIFI